MKKIKINTGMMFGHDNLLQSKYYHYYRYYYNNKKLYQKTILDVTAKQI